MKGIDFSYQDAIVISTRTYGFRINNVMINITSSVDVLFNRTYEKMVPLLTKNLKPYDHDLYVFNDSMVKVRGIISLPVELGND